MDWLVQNWAWLLLFVAFIGMHLFGHGGHGGRGGHGGCYGGSDPRPPDGEQPGKDRSQAHDHCEGVVMPNSKIASCSSGFRSGLTVGIRLFSRLAVTEVLHRHVLLEHVLAAFKGLAWRGFLLALIESLPQQARVDARAARS